MTKQWQEDSSFWDKPWTNEGGDYNTNAVAKSTGDTLHAWENFNITDAIKGFVENSETNYGFLLKFDHYIPGFGVRYCSSNYKKDPSLRPKVTVKYFYDDTQPPTVNIMEPSDTTVWEEGSYQKIKWEAQDDHILASFSIYFSSDDGATWELIDSINGNRKTLFWTVPNTPSENCRIKVYAYDADRNTASDLSDAFTIAPATEIFYQADMSGQIMIKKTKDSYKVLIPFAESSIAISDVKGRKLITHTTTDRMQWVTIPSDFLKGIYFIDIKTPHERIINRISLF